MELTAILAVAFIVSLDGLAAGAAYGARRVKLPFQAVVLISITSALTMLISMSAGSFLRGLLSETIANMVGALLLIALGVYFIVHQSDPVATVDDVRRDLVHFRIVSLGLVIRVWHDPLLADQDHSGAINSMEAIVLGLALALDAFGAGLGAAMTGLPPLATAGCIGVFKLVLVHMGLYMGNLLAGMVPPKVMALLPGVLLISLGVGQFL